MDENNVFEVKTEQVPATEQPEAEIKTKPAKNKYKILKIVFRILAVLILVSSIVCGVAFGFTQTTTLVPYGTMNGPTFKTETIFEVWRLVLFAIVGLSNGLCLWAVAEIFGALSKKKSK